MTDFVVLVDESDTPIGTMEKMEAHRKGLLHRAFSVFVFNSQNQLLIHQRSHGKYHSAGLWTNTCCSHQKPGETTLNAAHRRLKEEMGFDCPLEEKFNFIYKTTFDNELVEHEYDHVLTGVFDGIPQPNPEEVCNYKFVDIRFLAEDIERNPKLYTVWFKIALQQLIKNKTATAVAI